MPAPKSTKESAKKTIEAIKHTDDKRKNIPTAEFETNMREEERTPLQVAFERRNKDLDPQLVWRGKDIQDWSDLVVPAPALYIQEKVHPKALIDDLRRQSETANLEDQTSLFSDFNGVPEGDAKTEFYQHDANWTNRMILGDSLQVMASLAEREGLRGKVQCIYLDPPYGIKFNSNFQWSTTSRDVKDGSREHITRDPEQVKAFRDTWRDGIHSYLTYLRDRLAVARDLLSESGSIFVQIGSENVHRIRALLDEVFGETNMLSQITVWKTSSQTSSGLPTTCDFIAAYAKDKERVKYRDLFLSKEGDDAESAGEYKSYWVGFGEYKSERQALENGETKLRRFRPSPTTSQSGGDTSRFTFSYQSVNYTPGTGGWKTSEQGFERLSRADRLLHRNKSIS